LSDNVAFVVHLHQVFRIDAMLVTEHGLRFEKDGQRWRCVDHRGLHMSKSGVFELDGDRRTFATVYEALEAVQFRKSREPDRG
jgi:hypothetical protein